MTTTERTSRTKRKKRRKYAFIAVVIIAIIAIIGSIVWWQYGEGFDVYAVIVPIDDTPADCSGDTRLAVIGDFGADSKGEADVADMIDRWQVDSIVTVGDNNYPKGEASTMDKNVGQYYHEYIHPYQGSYGNGAAENRFYPALGNHDWMPGSIDPHLEYFTLPGNERYYDVVFGPVHVFILDSNDEEPDGRTADSIQAQWLQTQVAASTTPWKLVSLHHAPYGSGRRHGDNKAMQWPFAEWGVSAVLAGHEHSYERLHRDGIPYIVNGLGGSEDIHPFGGPKTGSAVRYNQDFGAMLITADETCINFTFYDRSDEMIDSYTLTK
jgi:hypothetical protein